MQSRIKEMVVDTDSNHFMIILLSKKTKNNLKKNKQKNPHTYTHTQRLSVELHYRYSADLLIGRLLQVSTDRIKTISSNNSGCNFTADWKWE